MVSEDDLHVSAASRATNASGVGGPYLDSGRSVPARHSLQWLAAGWRMFRRQAGVWILLALVFALIFVGIGIIPGIGQLAVTVLTPVFVGGMMLGCRKVERDEELELADLFRGFRRNTGALVLVGVIALLLMIAVMIVVSVITGAGTVLALASGNGPAAIGVGAMLPALLILALAIPVNMAVWFAPALVILHDEPAPRAMLQSFQACLKNIVPFLLYGVVLFVLAVVATMPLLLGWLVLGPVIVGSVYAAYRDIFSPS